MGAKKKSAKTTESPPPAAAAAADATILPQASSALPKQAFAVLLLALLAGFFFNAQLFPSPSPPSLAPTISASELAALARELVPSTEVCRGAPNTLQNDLYKALPPAVLYVLNFEEKRNMVDIFFQGEVKAVAPAQSKAKLESYIGQTFHIVAHQGGGSRNTLNITLAREFTAIKVDGLGRIHVLDQYASEDALFAAERAPPNLPVFPTAQHLKVLPTSTAKSIKIRNLSNRRFNEYWVPPKEDGDQLVYQGVIEPNHEATTNSYIGHTFRFTTLKNANKAVFEFTVRADQEIYAFVDERTADKEKLRAHLEEVEFGRAYKRAHGGQRPWLSYYPHQPVKTFMWPADYIGQEFYLHTDHGPDGGEGGFNFTLKVESVRPRAYSVDYFISDAECEFIKQRARSKLAKSSVEAHGVNGEIVDSATRTSKNAWLERGEDPILDRIYRRIADLLNVPQETLQQTKPNGFAESLQVVHYKDSAHYAPHHDWGVMGSPHTRLATVLLYLNEPEVGGETAFPKAIVGKREGLVVKPKRGRAVLFYSQHPDGNVDDESLHEARAVTAGEKWLANVWVHDKMYWGKNH